MTLLHTRILFAFVESVGSLHHEIFTSTINNFKLKVVLDCNIVLIMQAQPFNSLQMVFPRSTSCLILNFKSTEHLPEIAAHKAPHQ